jgi:hypothetical protein
VEVFLDFWIFSGISLKLGSKNWSKSVENEFIPFDVIIHLKKRNLKNAYYSRK